MAKDDTDRGEVERGLVNIENCIDETIQIPEEYIKKSKKWGLITAISNSDIDRNNENKTKFTKRQSKTKQKTTMKNDYMATVS